MISVAEKKTAKSTEKKPAAAKKPAAKKEAKPAEKKTATKTTVKKPAEKKPAAKTTAAKKPAAEKKPAAKKETKPAEKKAPAKKQFITYRAEDRKWAVTIESGKKATKLFNTKAEAEEYAKSLAKNQDTKVVRQKKDGKFQKSKY